MCLLSTFETPSSSGMICLRILSNYACTRAKEDFDDFEDTNTDFEGFDVAAALCQGTLIITSAAPQ